jgi:hypothetical protein
MGVKWHAVQARIRHVEADTGIAIPVNQEGIEYVALMSSMEVINYPEYFGVLARTFRQAGASWTMCSDAFEATNSGIQYRYRRYRQGTGLPHCRSGGEAQGENCDQPGVRARIHRDSLGRHESNRRARA